MSSNSYAELANKIGYSVVNETIKNLVKKYETELGENIKKFSKNKIEHFSKEEFAEIVNSSKNYKEISKKLGYADCNGNIKEIIDRYIIKYNLSTKHFTVFEYYSDENMIGKIFGNVKVIKRDENSIGK